MYLVMFIVNSELHYRIFDEEDEDDSSLLFIHVTRRVDGCGRHDNVGTK